MQASDEISQRIKEYLQQDEVRNLCVKLKVFSYEDSLDEAFEKTKQYIEVNMRGKFIRERAIDNFFKNTQFYLTNHDFGRIPEESNMINYNVLLPLGKQRNSYEDGFRVEGNILGPDGKEYILKHAEGLKGNISGRNYTHDAKFNPTMAYAFFKFLGQPCARNIIAFEKFPYYYILSENFLKNNQRDYRLDDKQFIGRIEKDGYNYITHKQIMDKIEKSINEKNLPADRAKSLSNKLKLQYAVQETLKCLICSMDENLGNTSFVVDEDENGEIKDINISPAYDLDLSFNLGAEMLNAFDAESYLYRTTQDGKSDLLSIMTEFGCIEGYKEQIEEIKNKLTGNYLDKIFDIAYETSGVTAFKDDKLKNRFGSFIMMRIATYKEAYKTIFEREDRIKS